MLELFALPSLSTTLAVNTSSSSKHFRLNEKSSILWLKRLDHISKQGIERLIKDEILPDLDFSNFYTCLDCIKDKLTTKVDRCTKFLRVIHTDICGSFTHLAMGGHKYFITFIDDYSCYGFVKLIQLKSDSLEAFKEKVELQQGKKIKVVYSNKGGEYYGRYDEMGHNLRPFAKYLQECVIDA